MIKFTTSETLTILEAARVALADAETFDKIAEDLCLEDGELQSLRDRLAAALDTDERLSLETGDSEALIPEGDCGNEYSMATDAPTAWISVETLSVCISRKDDGASVSIYPKGDEFSSSLAETWATFTEGGRS